MREVPGVTVRVLSEYFNTAVPVVSGEAPVKPKLPKLMARTSFWCVAETLEAAGLFTRAYHVAVPSFGEWGYVLARDTPFDVPTDLPPVPLKYLNDAVLPTLFVFPADMTRVKTEVNRLDNQILVSYYEREWKRWN